MTLNLYFLGQPRIERDGRPVDTDTRKATALLAYLAVSGNFQSRETLAALLWPEMDDDRARAALRRTLSSLRAAVGEQALYVTREGLSLNPDETWCDVTAFQAAVTGVTRRAGSPCPECLPQMQKAVDYYRDDFLSGFSLRDSVEFDNWQLAVTEQLRRSYSTALAWLVLAHTETGELERAIELGRRWLTVDPLREEAHRWVMQLHSWSGARDAALRQYREVVRILDEELGVGPLPETTALYEAIQEGRLPPRVGSPPVSTPLPAEPPPVGILPGHVPLIGRERAWESLLRIYGDISGLGRVTAVTGETGIGKTRLIEVFLQHVHQTGVATVAVTCHEGESGLAYAPIAAALNSLSRRPVAAEKLAAIPEHWLSEAGRLIPELEPATTAPLPGGGNPGAQTRFFAGISEVFCHLLNGSAPGVFFLDDAHWADEASLDLLAYLVRRLNDFPVMIILGWSDTLESSRRLRRLITEAQRAGTGELIELTRWRPSDVLALVAENQTLRPRATQIAERLYRETEGLPYFVVEYMAALSRTPDLWTIPQTVRDLLVGRLAGIHQTGQQLLQTAAVIGRSFDYTTLWEASGRSEEEVVSGLENLLARGLIREFPSEENTGEPAGELRYDFAQQQMRALVYEETNLARRRLLHRRVGASLQANARGPQGEAIASLIGDHFHLGGQDGTAADFYRRAGDHARALFANREALGHYRTALALGHPQAVSLQEAAGDLHTLLGEYQAALQAYESAAAQADRVDLGRLEHRIGQVYERRGNWESAESHYAAVLDHYRNATVTADLARLSVDRGRVAYQSGNMELARSLAGEALALGESAGDLVAQAQAHNMLGILARHEDKPDEARDHLERSVMLSESAGVAAARVAALNNLARLREAEGETGDALALLEQAITLCVHEGDRHREAALYNHRADLLHRAGQEEDAMSSLKQAVAIYAEIGMESGDWQPEIWKLTEW